MPNLVKVYWKDGTANDVAQADLSYWKSQGWTDSNPKAAGTTVTPTLTPVAPVSTSPIKVTPAPTSSVTPPVTPVAPTVKATAPTSNPYAQAAPSLPAGFTAITKTDQWGNPDNSSFISAKGPDGQPMYDVWQTSYFDGQKSVNVSGYKAIPKATLINAQGNRVAVRTDNPLDPGNGQYLSGGMVLPKASDYFSKGYALEKAPGVATGNTSVTTPGGAVDLSQQTKATLRKVNPDGTVSRVVVVSGSQDAQKYFAGGYTLETAAQAPNVAVTMKAPDGTSVAAKNTAEAQALMAKGYTPVTAATNTPVTAPTSTYGITSPDQANAIINKVQEQAKTTADQANDPPTRGMDTSSTNSGIDWTQFLNGGDTPTSAGSSNFDQALLESLKGISSTPAPSAPSLEKAYSELQTQYGVTDIKTQIDDLTNQERTLLADKQARVLSEKGKPVDLSLAAGRISQQEQQVNDKLSAVQQEKAYLVDSYNSKLSTIQTLMSYKQTDYQNAESSYKDQYSRNMQMIDALRGINTDQKTTAEKAKDDARANLTIVYNTLTSGGADLSTLSAADKLNISKLELQAGMPVGFVQSLQNKNPKASFLSTKDYVNNAGNRITEVLMMGDDGHTFVETHDNGPASEAEKASSYDLVQDSKTGAWFRVNKLTNTAEPVGMGGSGIDTGNGTGTGTPGGSGTGTISYRTNNPGNIKFGPYAKSMGATDSGIKATDGGTFAQFSDYAAGQKAQMTLLQSPSYANLTLEAAMKQWSGGGYGADVAGGAIPSNKKMKDLTTGELQTLQAAMQKREGWSGPSTTTQAGQNGTQFTTTPKNTGTGTLSASQKDEIATMDTVSDLAKQIEAFNADGKLEGIGGFMSGTLGQFITSNFGTGTEEEKTVRALVGNIKGTIAKMRGGTSFTPNEEALLSTYTPTIDESPESALTKLSLLKDFIAKKKANILSTAGVASESPASSQGSTPNTENLRNTYNY